MVKHNRPLRTDCNLTSLHEATNNEDVLPATIAGLIATPGCHDPAEDSSRRESVDI